MSKRHRPPSGISRGHEQPRPSADGGWIFLLLVLDVVSLILFFLFRSN